MSVCQCVQVCTSLCLCLCVSHVALPLTLLTRLQGQTYALLDSLRRNMCAKYFLVPDDDAEVKQVVGEIQQTTRLVASRSEDLSFALDLGTVLLDHVQRFAEHNSTSVLGDALPCWKFVNAALHVLSVFRPWPSV